MGNQSKPAMQSIIELVGKKVHVALALGNITTSGQKKTINIAPCEILSCWNSRTSGTCALAVLGKEFTHHSGFTVFADDILYLEITQGMEEKIKKLSSVSESDGGLKNIPYPSLMRMGMDMFMTFVFQSHTYENLEDELSKCHKKFPESGVQCAQMVLYMLLMTIKEDRTAVEATDMKNMMNMLRNAKTSLHPNLLYNELIQVKSEVGELLLKSVNGENQNYSIYLNSYPVKDIKDIIIPQPFQCSDFIA